MFIEGYRIKSTKFKSEVTREDKEYYVIEGTAEQPQVNVELNLVKIEDTLYNTNIINTLKKVDMSFINTSLDINFIDDNKVIAFSKLKQNFNFLSEKTMDNMKKLLVKQTYTGYNLMTHYLLKVTSTFNDNLYYFTYEGENILLKESDIIQILNKEKGNEN